MLISFASWEVVLAVLQWAVSGKEGGQPMGQGLVQWNSDSAQVALVEVESKGEIQGQDFLLPKVKHPDELLGQTSQSHGLKGVQPKVVIEATVRVRWCGCWGTTRNDGVLESWYQAEGDSGGLAGRLSGTPARTTERRKCFMWWSQDHGRPCPGRVHAAGRGRGLKWEERR